MFRPSFSGGARRCTLQTELVESNIQEPDRTSLVCKFVTKVHVNSRRVIKGRERSFTLWSRQPAPVALPSPMASVETPSLRFRSLAAGNISLEEYAERRDACTTQELERCGRTVRSNPAAFAR